MTSTLYTMGYSNWSTAQRANGIINGLRENRVNLLIDIRHSPCASDPNPTGNYSARAWNLQAEDGIEPLLAAQGIDYQWMVELGNPQKRDRTMAIMRSHLASNDQRWPVVRGLQLLAEQVADPGRVACLLCTCKDNLPCHRHLVAAALNSRHFDHGLEILNIGKGGAARWDESVILHD